MPSRATLAAPAWPTTITTSVETRDRAQTALALLFPGPARDDAARFARGDDRERRERAGRPLLRRAARQAVARATPCTRSRPSAGSPARSARTSRRRRSRRTRRATDCSPSSAAARRAGDARRSWRARRRTRSARTRSASRAAARCWRHRRRVSVRVAGELESYEASVRAVTAASMQAVAQEYFDQSRRVEGIVRGVGKKV